MVEQASRQAIAKVDDGRWEGEGDNGDEGLEYDEDDGENKGEVFTKMEARKERDMERHCSYIACIVCCMPWLLGRRLSCMADLHSRENVDQGEVV